MSLKREHITKDSASIKQIKELYEFSFPENERRPLTPMLDDTSGFAEILAYYDEDEFIGFACILNIRDISHIIYFAVDNKLRGKGYGSQILSDISAHKKGMRIIVDIEQENTLEENNSQRIKRKQFYLRNGYKETTVEYEWRNEKYEILSLGGDIDTEDFIEFWEKIDIDAKDLSIY